MKNSKTVLILGANGRFGAAAVTAFAEAGWNVIAQVRRPSTTAPRRVRQVTTGMGATNALVAAAAEASVVVYAINPPYTSWATDALPLARLGMDVASRLHALFMLPGNVYNFGDGMPDQLRENTPQNPTTRKGEIRKQLEQEMQQRAQDGLRSVVIRAGDFFGGGTGSWIDLVITKNLAKGKLTYPGPLDRTHAWAYLPDLARSFVAAANRTDLPPFSQLHFAGHTMTGEELLSTIERAAKSLGVTPAKGFQRNGMPWFILRIGGLVVPIWREIAEMAYLWSRAHALIDSPVGPAQANNQATEIDQAMRDALRALGFGRPVDRPSNAIEY